MRKIKLFLVLASLVVGCSEPSQNTRTQALFDTREEAEKAAKSFNCAGSHKMGEKWMPCSKHESKGHHHDHKKVAP